MATAAGKEIRNLLFVLGGGIVCAVAVAVMLLYYYNPTGRYYARNVLLDPQLTGQLSYMDLNPKTGGSSLFIFDSVEYSYYDSANKKWAQQLLTQETYRQFYDIVAEDRSLSTVTDEIEKLFSRPTLPRLVIKVKTKSDSEWQASAKAFIEVQFLLENDYYRIQLRSDSPTGGWAYFKHAKLLDELQTLFIRP